MSDYKEGFEDGLKEAREGIRNTYLPYVAIKAGLPIKESESVLEYLLRLANEYNKQTHKNNE